MHTGEAMDRPRQPDSRNTLRHVAWAAVAVLAILAFVLIDRYWLRQAPGVRLADVVTGVVRRGGLAIEVQGAGALAPVSERWITSRAAGTVEQIFVRPGQSLRAGDAVAGLVNPQLRQAVVRERLQLAEAKAARQRDSSNFVTQRLTAEEQHMNAQATYEEQRLRLEAQEELRAKNAISEIDYRTARIRAEQAKARLDFEQQRLAELDATLAAEQRAADARLAAREASLREAEEQVAALRVTTDVAGTLRELLVEPGQPVGAGVKVARVVDTSSLIGVVRVPESYASRLAPGQAVAASVLNVEVSGVVARVDPAVSEGAVAVDVEFTAPLPEGVRPELSMQATMTVAELPDTLYVRRPVHVYDDTVADVFRLADDQGSATRTAVRFGLGTLRNVQVLDGLAAGDTILLGNVARHEGRDTIALR